MEGAQKFKADFKKSHGVSQMLAGAASPSRVTLNTSTGSESVSPKQRKQLARQPSMTSIQSLGPPVQGLKERIVTNVFKEPSEHENLNGVNIQDIIASIKQT